MHEGIKIPESRLHLCQCKWRPGILFHRMAKFASLLCKQRPSPPCLQASALPQAYKANKAKEMCRGLQILCLLLYKKSLLDKRRLVDLHVSQGRAQGGAWGQGVLWSCITAAVL